MTKPERKLSQLRADLDAANREVEQVMGQNAHLKKEAAEAYQRGYTDATRVGATIAKVNQHQAELIAYYIGIITGQDRDVG